MRKVALYGMFLMFGIIIGLTIQSAAAVTVNESVTLQKQVSDLTARLNLLQTAFSTNAAGITTIKGTSITIQGTQSINIKASGPLTLKGNPLKSN